MQSTQDKSFDAFLQRVITPDDEQRAALMQEIARREAEGKNPALDDAGRLHWRAWLIDYARREPWIFALAPFSALCYLWLVVRLAIDAWRVVMGG